MDLYAKVGFETSRMLTQAYSTSFGTASRLFGASVRPHIYTIYAMVRIGDEIVDTYAGPDALRILDEFEKEVYAAITRQYSANVVAHAFAMTAKEFGIGETLIQPYFASMRQDITVARYDSAKEYETYIYGSAEVVGLMCLKVFCKGDAQKYERLKPGARALGAAFQKINFLRDIRADAQNLQRVYFPGVDFAAMDEEDKRRVVEDSQKDLAVAKEALLQLPASSRTAVMVAYTYYEKLLQKIDKAPVEKIKTKRLRIKNAQKMWLLVCVVVRERLRSGR